MSFFCLVADLQIPVTEPDINNRLESLCRSMTEHALEGKSSVLISPKSPHGCAETRDRRRLFVCTDYTGLRCDVT